MKKFIDFFYEDAIGSTTAGMQSSIDNPPGRKKRNVVTTVNMAPPQLNEDPKEEQRSRLLKQKSQKADISINKPEYEFPLSSVGKIAEERDYEGKLLTPARKEAGGYWADEDGKPKWVPRAPLSGGYKRLDLGPPKPPSGPSKAGAIPAKEDPGIRASQQQKAREAEEKAEMKRQREGLQKQRLQKALKKAQEEKPTLRQILNKNNKG